MRDNRGFSLIEMIIVIAILAVLTSASIGMFGLKDNGYARENAKSVETMLEQAAYNTQAKAAKYWMVKLVKTSDEYQLELYKVKDGDVTELVDSKTLAGSVEKTQVAVSSLFSGAIGVSNFKVDESNPVSIYFEKQTGEVAKLVLGSTEYDAEKLKGQTGTITVVSDKQSRGVEIYWSTGKIFAE